MGPININISKAERQASAFVFTAFEIRPCETQEATRDWYEDEPAPGVCVVGPYAPGIERIVPRIISVDLAQTSQEALLMVGTDPFCLVVPQWGIATTSIGTLVLEANKWLPS